MEGSQIICKHCGKQIIASNYLLHESRCQLMSSRAAFQPRQSLEIKPQLIRPPRRQERRQQNPYQMKKPEEFHRESKRQPLDRKRQKIFFPKRQEQEEKIPCSYCGYMQTYLELDTHPNQCQHSPKQCEFCHQNFPKSLMDEHLQVCSARVLNRNVHGHISEQYEPQHQEEYDQDYDPYGNFSSIFNQREREPTFQRQTGYTLIEQRDGRGNVIRRIIPNNGSHRHRGQIGFEQQEFQQQRQGFNPFLNFFNLLQMIAGRNNPDQGLTKQQIKNLQKIEYRLAPNQEKDLCTVCYCEFEDKEKVIKLRCKHLYHQECIIKWLQKNAKCPVCKQSQTDRQIFNEQE